jgi:hypothetical protein
MNFCKILADVLFSFTSGLAKFYWGLFQNHHLLSPHYCLIPWSILCHVAYTSTIKMEAADSPKHWYLPTKLLSVTSHKTVIFIILIRYCHFKVCQLCHCFGFISYIYILILTCTVVTTHAHTLSDLRIHFYRVNTMHAMNRCPTCLLGHIETRKWIIIKPLYVQDKHGTYPLPLFPKGNCISPTVRLPSNVQQFHDNPRHWSILQ